MIAVDANPATRDVVTGTETYARELCARLRAAGPDLEWTFYASRPSAGLGFDLTVVPFARLWSQARLPVRFIPRRPPGAVMNSYRVFAIAFLLLGVSCGGMPSAQNHRIGLPATAASAKGSTGHAPRRTLARALAYRQRFT